MSCCAAVGASECVVSPDSFDVDGILEAVRKQLAREGIAFESCCGGEPRAGKEGAGGMSACHPQVKVVCVAPNLQASVEEMSRSARDQVVMVRVDHETARKLDAWVETDAVRSRSEAAALFIREGLKVRASELERLHDALRGVEDAKERLRREARHAFGLDGDVDPEATPEPSA